MDKKESLNENLASKEEITLKKSRKLKIALVIIFSLFIILSTTLLVGYFKFDWFKNEIYSIDAKIRRNVYQANYFSETKIIETKYNFSSGQSETKELSLFTNFMVIPTKKEKIKNEFLITATLIILEIKFKIEKEIKQGIYFNISDEKIINQIKSNPDANKYPIAIFSFFENGTLVDINLPSNMNISNANAINELVENIIPKLTRNRTEDLVNGIQIFTKKNNKKKTLVENHSHKEIKEFEKSNFEKFIERDIENEQLKSIRTKSYLSLKSQPGKNESDFGLKDFSCKQNSVINSTGIKDEKEKNELIQKLSSYYTFIKIQDLIKLNEENEKQSEKEEETEYDVQYIGEDENLSDYKLRKLDYIGVDKTFTIKELDVLGQKIYIKIRIRVNGRRFFRSNIDIILKSDLGEVNFGSMVLVDYKKTFTIFDKPFFVFVFPPMPSIIFALRAGGVLTISLKLTSDSLTAGLSGSLHASAIISAGIWDFANVSGGARGTIVNADISGVLRFKRNRFIRKGRLRAGEIITYVEGKTFGMYYFYKEWKIFDLWSRSF